MKGKRKTDININDINIDDKLKMLDDTVSEIESRYGKGTIMRLEDTEKKEKIDVIPSGSYGLNLALGVGGFPRGRIVEIFGPEGSGKTTLALETVAQAQKHNGVCVYIDSEHALDIVYAKNIGVDFSQLKFSQPDYGEMALEEIKLFAKSGIVDLVVVDSVASLVPKAELEGDMGEFQVGYLARMMSQAMRKLAGVLSHTKTCAIFINQVRMKIGHMSYGNPETTPGGKALKFHASVRCDIRKIQTLKRGEKIIGSRTRVKVIKNKLAPPYRQADFDIIYGKGISRNGELFDIGVQRRVIQKEGKKYIVGTEQIGVGRDDAIASIGENKVLRRGLIRELLRNGNIEKEEEEEEKEVGTKCLVCGEVAEEGHEHKSNTGEVVEKKKKKKRR